MFTQYAKGAFSVEVKGPWHCGPDHTSPKKFNYEILIDWKQRASLDFRGFLIDNLTFQEYFDALGSTELSCEQLVKHCAEVFYQICGGKPRQVEVKLWALPDAVMVAYTYVPVRRIPGPEWIATILGVGGEIVAHFFRF